MTMITDQLHHAHLRVMLGTLEELRITAGLNGPQIAAMGDLKRALGIETAIRSTLTADGKVTARP